MQGSRSIPFAFLLVVGFVPHSSPQSTTPPPFEVLRSFDSPPVRPLGGLIEGPGGLYGASQGGRFGEGSIFRVVLPTVSSGASIEDVYSFTDAGLAAGQGGALSTPLLASDGYFYGVGRRGGGNSSVGWVFRVSATGERTALHMLTAQDGVPLDYPFYGQGPLVELGDWLYGALYGGGPSNKGTVFRVSRTDGTFERLHGFSGPDGELPAGGLVRRGDWLYGTTLLGGANGRGTLFRISPDGTAFEAVHHFVLATEGTQQLGELALGPDGLLYGALRVGGPATPFGCGSIFRFDPDSSGPGAFTLLASFACNGTAGTNPEAGMVIAENADGSRALYGLTTGSNNPGEHTVFRLSLEDQPTLTILETLPRNEYCSGRLRQASNGHIYGQCLGAFGSDEGRVFRIDPASGSVSTVVRFGLDGVGGHTPYALIESRDGQLYGTTRKGGPANRGSVFRFSRAGDLEILHDFTDSTLSDDSYGPGSNELTEYAVTFLTHGSDGLIYGARCDGGTYGKGSLFSLDPGLGSYQTLYSASVPYLDRTACPHGPLVESPTAPGTFFGTATGGTDHEGSAFRFDASTGEVEPLWETQAGGLSLFSEPVGRIVIGPDGLLYTAYTQYLSSFFSRHHGGVVQALPEGGVVRAQFFNSNVSAPVSGLVHGPSTPTGGFVLYGTSVRGGLLGWGSVYKATVGDPGDISVVPLRSFAGGSDGSGPRSRAGARPRWPLLRNHGARRATRVWNTVRDGRGRAGRDDPRLRPSGRGLPGDGARRQLGRQPLRLDARRRARRRRRALPRQPFAQRRSRGSDRWERGRGADPHSQRWGPAGRGARLQLGSG